MNFSDLYVGELDDFSYDFRNNIAAGVTITGAQPTVLVHAGVDPTPQAMVVGGPSIAGTVVTVRLRGNVPASYWPRVTATLSDGRQVTLPDPGEGSLRVVA